MLKFEWKGEIDQNVEIWVNGGINENIKFEDKVGNQSKCWNWVPIVKSIKMWNLSANVGIYQKLLKFERKRGDWSNVDILLQKWNRSKCCSLIEK